MRYVFTVAAAVAALMVAAGSASAKHYVQHKPFASMTATQKVKWLHRQAQHDRGAIRWFTRHLVPVTPTTPRFLLSIVAVLRIPQWQGELRWYRTSLAITTRNLEHVQAQIAAATAFPPHHALWMCEHSHEASDWHNQDTGGNGHWGGLQMHPGYGYGTSYHASDDSQFTQEWAAERAFAASGYSTSWLLGQWYHPDCLAYA